MINLVAGKCVACRAGEPTLTDAEIEDLLLHVHQWQVSDLPAAFLIFFHS